MDSSRTRSREDLTSSAVASTVSVPGVNARRHVCITANSNLGSHTAGAPGVPAWSPCPNLTISAKNRVCRTARASTGDTVSAPPRPAPRCSRRSSVRKSSSNSATSASPTLRPAPDDPLDGPAPGVGAGCRPSSTATSRLRKGNRSVDVDRSDSYTLSGGKKACTIAVACERERGRECEHSPTRLQRRRHRL
jgi:hypothetical protein